VATLLSALALTLGCGPDEGTVTATFLFQSLAAQNNTESLHIYALEQRGDKDCSDLVADEADPLDAAFKLKEDAVILLASEDTAKLDALPSGTFLIYAEASNVVGETILAGCAELSIDGDKTVELLLGAPGTFDCSDADTTEGAPCDDGEFCTTGEACNGGNCVGGSPRNCSYLEDDCNGVECTETFGCQPVPVPDGRICEDGVFCTAGDSCQEGQCVTGTAEADCSSFDTECGTGQCNEGLDDCERVDADAQCNADACFSGTCNASGSCDLTPFTCPDPGHDCYDVGACTDVGGLAVCQPVAKNPGGGCNDICMTGGTCDGTECVGGTGQPAGTEGPAGDPTCNNVIDDDCDGLIDTDDDSCQ